MNEETSQELTSQEETYQTVVVDSAFTTEDVAYLKDIVSFIAIFVFGFFIVWISLLIYRWIGKNIG